MTLFMSGALNLDIALVNVFTLHNNEVIMGTTVSQITSLTIVYSIVYSCTDQRKYQSSASLVFVRGIHRWPVYSPHKWPVTRKIFPFDDVIVAWWHYCDPALKIVWLRKVLETQVSMLLLAFYVSTGGQMSCSNGTALHGNYSRIFLALRIGSFKEFAAAKLHLTQWIYHPGNYVEPGSLTND